MANHRLVVKRTKRRTNRRTKRRTKSRRINQKGGGGPLFDAATGKYYNINEAGGIDWVQPPSTPPSSSTLSTQATAPARVPFVVSTLDHPAGVDSVAWAHDWSLLATGSSDNTVRLWRFSDDGARAECTATLAGHTGSVKSVAFHLNPIIVEPGKRLLATGSTRGGVGGGGKEATAVKLWSCSRDGKEASLVATLDGGSRKGCPVAFHPRLPLLATNSDDTVKLWWLRNPSDPLCVSSLVDDAGGSVVSLAFHPTAPLMAFGNDAGTVKLCRFSDDGSALTCVATLVGHIGTVWSVAFHPRLPLLATGSGDNTAKLWRFSPDGSTATCEATLGEHSRNVFSVAFHPTLPVLATGSFDGTAKLCRFSDDGSALTCLATLTGGHGDTAVTAVTSVAFDPASSSLAIGSWDKTVKTYKIIPGTTIDWINI